MRFDYEKIDVVEFLQSLGIRNVKDLGLEVSYSCPFEGHRKGDLNPSAMMCKTTIVRDDGTEYPPTTFHCFTCGRAGTAVSFLAEYEDVSQLIARKMLREKFGMSFKEPEDTLWAELNEQLTSSRKRKLNDYSQPKIEDSELEDRIINWNYGGPETTLWQNYMFSRGFTAQILTEFQIGYDARSRRISIPIYDEQERLVGFKGRIWEPGDKRSKYIALGGEGYEFEPYDTSKILFAFPQATRSSNYLTQNQLIIVEGELNTIAMHQKGFPNSVGISGQYLSERQAELIRHSCNSAVLFFDDLDKAKMAADKLERYVRVSIIAGHLESGADAAELSEQEIATLYYSRQSPLML